MNKQLGKVDLSKFKIKINGIDLQQYYKEKFGTKFKVGDKVHIIESVEDENDVKWIYSGKAEIEAVVIVLTRYLLTLRYKLSCLDDVLEKIYLEQKNKQGKNVKGGIMGNKPSYTIVRVDNNCPFMQEKLDFSSCSKMFNCDKFIRCEKCEHNCRYGDTKEQLIRKIVQAIKRKLKGGLILRNTKINETYNIQKAISIKAVAKEIVEFLGIEE